MLFITKAIAFFKSAGLWIVNNFKLFMIIAGLVIVTILVLLWRNKSNKIKQLQAELFLAQSKIQLADLARKYAVSMAQFMNLRQQDVVLDKKLNEIEKDLAEKVDPDMTAEEVAAKFREMGVRP